MSHTYHRNCGCASCCDEELADERRDEYIDDFSPREAKKLVGMEGFAADALSDVSVESAFDILKDVARFFEKYHNTPESRPTDLRDAARDLYLDIKPTIEAAADERARDVVAKQYDKMMKEPA